MEDLLRALLDREAVIEAVMRLFVHTDNRDWAAVEACFTPEVLFDMTSLAGGSPAVLGASQITAAWDQGLRRLEAVHHQAGNFLVTVRGDEADLFCYALASHYLRNLSEWNTRTFVGSYDVHLVRVGTGWRIDRFKFNLKYVDGNPALEDERRNADETL